MDSPLESGPVVGHKGRVFPDGYFPKEASLYLRLEFESRLSRRPHYSLRAFARDLQMSPAALSDFLRGKAGLSRERSLSVARRMSLSPDHIEHFCDLVGAKHARSKGERAVMQLRARHRVRAKSSELALDQFQLISEWYHLALLELVNLDSRYHSIPAAAKALGLKTSVMKGAVERVERLGLLVRDGPREWRTASPSTTVGDQVTPSSAIRSFHRQMLERALVALEEQDVSQRNFETAILSVRRADIPEMKAELQRRFVEIMKKYHQRGDKDALYAMTAQLFRVDAGPKSAASEET